MYYKMILYSEVLVIIFRNIYNLFQYISKNICLFQGFFKIKEGIMYNLK